MDELGAVVVQVLFEVGPAALAGWVDRGTERENIGNREAETPVEGLGVAPAVVAAAEFMPGVDGVGFVEGELLDKAALGGHGGAGEPHEAVAERGLPVSARRARVVS